MNMQEYSKQLTKGSGSNFYYSFLFLPKRKREAMYAVYAFCRHCDDIVDGTLSPDEAAAQLKYWQDELERCYQGRAEHPIAVKLSETLKRFPIPKRYFEELIEGMEMDLWKTRYATFDELRQYCYRAASVVGLICLEIFGYQSQKAKDYAENLGIAFQLTNILRDLVPDLERGRIYLPLEDLERFSYSEDDLSAHAHNDAFLKLMRFECLRAKGYFQRAEAAFPREDSRSLVAAEIMRAIYWRLLKAIERSPSDVFRGKVSLSKPHRLLLAFSIWLKSRLF